VTTKSATRSSLVSFLSGNTANKSNKILIHARDELAETPTKQKDTALLLNQPALCSALKNKTKQEK
jgi:hypothetical protein